jgi:hypothetical protein
MNILPAAAARVALWLLGGFVFNEAVFDHPGDKPEPRAAQACYGYLQPGVDVQGGAAVPPRMQVVELRPHSDYWYLCPNVVALNATDRNAVPVYLIPKGTHFVPPWSPPAAGRPATKSEANRD